jgi:hypothetical protein
MCVSFRDLLKELDVGDAFLVISDDVFVLDTREGVAVFEVAVGILSKCLIASHPYSGEVVSVAMAIIGRLVVGHEKVRQCCP